MWNHGKMNLPTGEIRSQDVLMMYNSGAKPNFLFWIAIAVVVFIEILFVRGVMGDREATYAEKADYRITACEVEEREGAYHLQITFENAMNFPAYIQLDANVPVIYESPFVNARTQKPIEDPFIPAYAETTVTYRVDKGSIREEGLKLQLQDVYEPQEWQVELP